MNVCKRLCLILPILLMPLFLTGCWNYREIDDLRVVSGLAIDPGQEGHKYHLTVQYVNMAGCSASNGPKADLLEVEGDTIFDAIRNAIKQSKNRLFFVSCKIVIINNKLASEGILPLLDFFTRDAEVRITMDILISKDKKAGDVLQNKSKSQDISAYTINKIIDNYPKFLGKSVDIELYKINNILYGQGQSLTLPAISSRTTPEKIIPYLSGTAVFKQDKLVGFLDDRATRYFLYTTDQIKGGIEVISLDSENNIALEINKSKTKLSPVIKNGKVSMNIETETDVYFAEENSSQNNFKNLGIEEMQKRAANSIKKGITEIIQTVQVQYKSDIFGFGKCIYQNYPQYWEKISPKWDNIFPTVECNVISKVNISNTATARPRSTD